MELLVFMIEGLLDMYSSLSSGTSSEASKSRFVRFLAEEFYMDALVTGI